MNPKPILWIFRGLPGSGKSTEARKLGCLVVEPLDNISTRGNNYIWDPVNWSSAGRAWVFACELIRHCSFTYCDVAVAEVLPRIEEIEAFKELAEQFNMEFRVVDMPTISVEESNRRNTHNVKLEDIKQMKNDWVDYPEPFTPSNID